MTNAARVARGPNCTRDRGRAQRVLVEQVLARLDAAQIANGKLKTVV